MVWIEKGRNMHRNRKREIGSNRATNENIMNCYSEIINISIHTKHVDPKCLFRIVTHYAGAARNRSRDLVFPFNRLTATNNHIRYQLPNSTIKNKLNWNEE